MKLLKTLWLLFLGPNSNSEPGTLDIAGWWSTVRDALILVAAETAVYGLEALSSVDWGNDLIRQIVATSLAGAIIWIRRWSKNYQPSEPVSSNIVTFSDTAR